MLVSFSVQAGYMSGMLVPVGVGIAGALFILGALYSIKVMNRRRRNGFKRHKRKVWNQQQQNLISFRTFFAFPISLIKHTGLNDARMVLTCPVVWISCYSCCLGFGFVCWSPFKRGLFFSFALQQRGFNAFLFSFSSRENSTACKIVSCS